MSKKINLYKIPASLKQTERIDYALKLLGLEGMRSAYERIAQDCIKNKKTPYDFLDSLCDYEANLRDENRRERWIKLARFPKPDTLEAYNFSEQPTLDETQIKDLATCRFIEKRENLIFLGSKGVGKTHLASSLGQKAIDNGHDVRFFTLGELVDLIEGKNDAKERHQFFTSLLKPRLLIIDEMDMYETTANSATFLFKLFHQRYETGSIVLTSNRSPDEWGRVFGSQQRAAAILDRLFHHSIIIKIEGDSHRMKDKLKLPKNFNDSSLTKKSPEELETELQLN